MPGGSWNAGGSGLGSTGAAAAGAGTRTPKSESIDDDGDGGRGAAAAGAAAGARMSPGRMLTLRRSRTRRPGGSWKTGTSWRGGGGPAPGGAGPSGKSESALPLLAPLLDARLARRRRDGPGVEVDEAPPSDWLELRSLALGSGRGGTSPGEGGAEGPASLVPIDDDKERLPVRRVRSARYEDEGTGARSAALDWPAVRMAGVSRGVLVGE